MENLNQGFYLMPIDIEDTEQYSYLYKDGKRLSKTIFRKGGLSSGFHDGFCHLLKYKKSKGKMDFGYCCIVNEKGKVILESKNLCTYIYHWKGVIATMNQTYYNLLTGKPIVRGYDNVKSENFYFIENSYEKEYPLGVYKISFETGEFEIFN